MEPKVEQLIKPGANITIQVEPSEKVLHRLDKLAVGTGAAYGFLAGLVVAAIIVIVLRQNK